MDLLRRERTARVSEPELARFLESEWTLVPTVEEAFSAYAVKDSQLRMMFSCCDPHLSEEAQIALILHILCGFSVEEIAQAFVSSHAAIEKRITRAKKILAASTQLFDLADNRRPAENVTKPEMQVQVAFSPWFTMQPTELAAGLEDASEIAGLLRVANNSIVTFLTDTMTDLKQRPETRGRAALALGRMGPEARVLPA